MINLFRYELQKFIYNKKNTVILISLILFLTGFIVYNNQLDKQYPIDMSEKLEDIADYSNKTAKGITMSMTNIPEGEYKQQLEVQHDYWLKLYTKSLVLVNGYKYDGYQNADFLKTEIVWNELLLEGMENGYNLDVVTRDTKKTIQEQISKDQYILNNKVKIPHSPYECNFLNLFKLVFTGYTTLFLLFLFLLMVFDISAVEFETGSYKIMYSSKESIKKIILTKLAFSIFLIIFFLLIMTIVFAAAGFVFGFGDPNYPYPVLPDIFPLYFIILTLLPLYFIALLVLSCMILFISYITYSSSVTLVVMITSYMMVIVFQQIFNFDWLYPYIPFCYPFNREIIQVHGTWVCSGIGIVLSLFLMIICIKSMSKRDILV